MLYIGTSGNLHRQLASELLWSGQETRRAQQEEFGWEASRGAHKTRAFQSLNIKICGTAFQRVNLTTVVSSDISCCVIWHLSAGLTFVHVCVLSSCLLVFLFTGSDPVCIFSGRVLFFVFFSPATWRLSILSSARRIVGLQNLLFLPGSNLKLVSVPQCDINEWNGSAGRWPQVSVTYQLV